MPSRPPTPRRHDATTDDTRTSNADEDVNRRTDEPTVKPIAQGQLLKTVFVGVLFGGVTPVFHDHHWKGKSRLRTEEAGRRVVELADFS
jgi:hypothetical protein